MIHGLKPYPDYRHSSDRWLEKVPSLWERVRIKYLLQEIDRRTQTGEEPLLSMRRDHGLVPLSQFSEKVAEPKALLAYKLVKSGELVVNRMQAGNGLVFVARIPGLISPDYAIFRPVRKVNLDYIELLFRSYAMRAKFRSESTGLGTGTAGFLRLYGDSLGAIEIGLPSLEEQSRIVRFIDHASRQIARYIRAKRRLIALLNEQKQAIIQRAVTRGIDPTVRLKASGIEWLGDIPENWSLKRFKFLVRVTSGQVDPRAPEHRSKILIAPNHIKSGAGRITLEETAEAQGADSGKYEIRRGQVVYSKIRPNLRKAAIALSDGLCSADMYPLTVRESELRPEFLLLLLLSVPFTKFVVDCSLRVAMPKVNREALGEGWLWYPGLESQDAIVKWTSDSTALLDVALGRAERSVSLLRDYRSRLIADVITGKVDVRDAASHLPDAPTRMEDNALIVDEMAPESAELDEAEAEVTT